ncbi:DUF3078 domain-containing protein [Roseimarinus sediminis]|uniref:DUF3078 domain-containing protein n=1 Tax=Roseimarinus sediminis TaxID=1610899 RepID=UPI003D1C8EE1
MKTVKHLGLLLILLLAFNSGFGQTVSDTTYWKNGGDFTLNFTQVSFTNWSAGGQNSVAGVSKFKYFARYEKSGVKWENLMDVGYGLSKVEGLEIQKSEDLIDFASNVGLKASGFWSYNLGFSFKSQFAPGYSDATNTVKTSNFLSPAYLSLTAGMEYQPVEFFKLMLSPLSGKMTIVTDDEIDATNYGLETADATTRMELGATMLATLKTPIVKNVDLATELGLFSNYLDEPQNIDVDWKLGINMKINDYLSAQINTRLIYDEDIKDPVDDTAKIQFKELLGIGLNFKF